jgi:hypothetical protein
MRNVYKALSLFLLLLTAQQGAVVHELSHLSGTDRARAGTDQARVRVDAGGTVDTSCALCPAFAQAASPTFSHSFQIPLLVRMGSQLTPEPRFVGVDASVPRPRSRGPPSLS